MTSSESARATRQLRISPGGKIPNSERSLPELPPSSATVTTAVMFDVMFFRPRSRFGNPLPPPITTTLGPAAKTRSMYRESNKRELRLLREIVVSDLARRREPARTNSAPAAINTPLRTQEGSPSRLTIPARAVTHVQIETWVAKRIPMQIARAPNTSSAIHRFNEMPGTRKIRIARPMRRFARRSKKLAMSLD